MERNTENNFYGVIMIKAFITQKSSDNYFKEANIRPLKENFGGGGCNVVVDTSQRFQKHMGFGGAFTEAAWRAVSVLPETEKKKVIDAYFSKSGLCYNLARIPVHTTDFSIEPRTYIEDGDKELKTFDTEWDGGRFEFYKQCREASDGLFTLISPWSPPAFMKDNNKPQHGGKLLGEYREAWANYYCKFIEDLRSRGITVDALTVQNEPEAVQIWESCIYTPEEEGYFIRDYLCPALKKHGLENTKIVLWDHNRDGVIRRSLSSFAIEGVRDLVWGIGYHWYCCDKSENLSAVHALYPEKALFLTECCVELAHDSTTGEASYAGIWEHGERYGRQIINDFNNYSQGWIDWNIILDEEGGPTYVGNFCEAPVMIDKHMGKVSYMSSYYYIGHFSKFIKAGATRVFCGNDAPSQLYSVAYENPDKSKIIVIQNSSSRRREITLTVDGKGTRFSMRPHSIMTLVAD